MWPQKYYPRNMTPEMLPQKCYLRNMTPEIWPQKYDPINVTSEIWPQKLDPKNKIREIYPKIHGFSPKFQIIWIPKYDSKNNCPQKFDPWKLFFRLNHLKLNLTWRLDQNVRSSIFWTIILNLKTEIQPRWFYTEGSILEYQKWQKNDITIIVYKL